MPIPAVIAAAAQNYRFNDGFLENTVKDLSPAEWLKRPENMNHMAWIVGHCAWTRRQLVSRLGGSWSRPDLDLYGRGVKLADDSAYPAPASLLATWREAGQVLAEALENVAEDWLAQTAPPSPRSTDGKMSGVVGFLAIHETYHIGQASYLRGWLGHKGLMG